MVLRKQKRKKGDYPPNPKQWDAESNGIDLRGQFEIPLEVPLSPFDLQLDGVHLLSSRQSISEIVDVENLNRLLGIHSRVWSGITIPVDDEFVVIVNPTHADTRRNATLTEEFFHILLEHKPTRIYECPITGISRREYDERIETEAYNSAAAALVPYRSLKQFIESGKDPATIAKHFQVSNDLVEFRLKTCKLFRRTPRFSRN